MSAAPGGGPGSGPPDGPGAAPEGARLSLDRQPPRNIVLIGSMGAGKTTVGTILAERLGFTLVDTDALVEKEDGRTIAQIWEADGEEAFRALEAAAVLKACAGNRRVIACGGGSVLNLVNYGVLRGAGPIVYLRGSAPELWRRVEGGDERPLARDRKAFTKLLAERSRAYESAADHQVVVDGRAPDDIADEIIRLVG